MAETQHGPNKVREKNLKQRYGLTEAQYNAILARQKGRCAICHRFRKLSVDHCHGKGRVRGLLCSNCNSALGLFEENATIMASATKYIRTHKGGP
jgi:hypothetical protein